VDNARYVGLIRAAAAIWVPSSVASKDFLRKLPFYASHFSKMLFKATDLKKSVHGNFDYDVMDIDKIIAISNLSMQKSRPHTMFASRLPTLLKSLVLSVYT
ncbi:hypothetical protein Tco_1128906, partial [Tanacetum coccineum]